MDSKAKLLGHPLHQILIVFPLGLLVTSTAFDALQFGRGGRRRAQAGYYMLAAGVTTGVAAAVPGVIDFLGIPWRTRAKRVGLLHGLGNLAVTGLFAASWAARRHHPEKPSGGAIALSVAGTALGLVTAWLGGELVDRLAVGVYEDANLDASSSLDRHSAA